MEVKSMEFFQLNFKMSIENMARNNNYFHRNV